MVSVIFQVTFCIAISKAFACASVADHQLHSSCLLELSHDGLSLANHMVIRTLEGFKETRHQPILKVPASFLSIFITSE